MPRYLYILCCLLMTGCGKAAPVMPVAAKVYTAADTAELSAFVGAHFAADKPGAVVWIAQDDTVLLAAAYGLADITSGRKMSLSQALPVSSITKSFTAAAILKLVEQGKLSLSDDVRRYLPLAPVAGHSINIDQLLTHTSGIPSLVDTADFLQWAAQPRTTQQLLQRTAAVPFHFPPGEGFAYSDSGYILLGAILEQQTRLNWAAAIQQLVTQPLQLSSVAAAAQWQHPATGYRYDGSAYQVATAIDWSVPHASGALVATAEDIFRWLQAWRNHNITAPALHQQAWQPRLLPNGRTSGYGYGWQYCDFSGFTAVQHGGWVPGFTASVLHLPERRLTAIALLNSEGHTEASYLTRQALRLLLTGKPHITPYTLSSAEKKALSGRYQNPLSNTIWQVSTSGDQLLLQLGKQHIELTAISATQACAADSDGSWCFDFQFDTPDSATSVTAALSCEPQGLAVRLP